MKFLKGFALFILNSLLFLSLSVFVLLFTVNSTVLSPNFIVKEIDRINIASLVEETGELIAEQIPEEEFPEELRVALIDTITKLEPVVKEQVGAAIYPVYDYLLGKSQSLDLALVLGDTFLSSDFVVSLVDELDIPLLAEAFLSERVIEQIPAEELPEEFRVALIDAVDDVITELEPWMKEQVGVVADPIFDYLLGKSQSFSVVISLQPMMEILEDTLKEAFLESLPPEYADLPQAELEQYFDEFFGELAEGMPSTFELNESMLGTEAPAEIAKSLAEAEAALAEARPYIGYFQLGYNLLIGFIVLLILGIILIHRQVKGASRGLGISFLTFGVPIYVGILVAKYIATTQLTQLDIPPQLQSLVPQLLNDFLAPVQTLCLSLLIGGVALIVVSIVYKPRQPSV